MASDGFLYKYFMNNSGKVLHKWLNYFHVYETHFERFRGKAPVMLEIGVSGGGSLAMWKAYLGEGARIIGVDINPDCKVHEADGIEIFIGNQSDPRLIEEIFAKYPEIDIVLDDGSHLMTDLQASFAMMYPRISKEGVYVVEDLQTCYWEEYGGGLRRDGTFIEVIKGLIDELNAVYSRDALPVTPFTASTNSINIYDAVVAFEKRPQGRRQALVTAAMPV